MPNDRVTLETGRPWPLGASVGEDGVNFALFSAHAEQVDLCLFDDSGWGEVARVPLPGFSDQVWHGFLPGAGPGLLYGYRVHGPYAPEQGYRFNSNKLLLDPYARDYHGEFRWSARQYGYPRDAQDADLALSESDNAVDLPKCRVVDETFDWEDDRAPDISLADTVLYEVHAKGFTRRHPGVPENLRGTYAGFAHPSAVDHLRRLGVTAVELLPVHTFVDEPELTARGLSNYWGYNSIGFFAPMARYGSNGPAEFKAMVKQLHRAGIEIILDVVYNHTAEGDQSGPTLSFRGIDNVSYYRLQRDNPRYYVNHSGCGNMLDATHPRVVQLVMDSLRYWAGEMHVDGFRFDLATCLARGGRGFSPRAPLLAAIGQDPVLSRLKLIAEPWDVGPGGYQVGRFPPGWSEWCDRFRDSSRAFWLQQSLSPAELAPRLAGSSDLFHHDGRAPQASINAITTHDGFTLHDVVSYSRKYNEANGQDNADGSDNNLSVNGGVDGETEDPEINALRSRLKRNLLATLMLSQGVPMLLAGDESGHTQKGNNNAYCQDNDITWPDWERMDTALLAFTRRLIALRKAHPSLRRTDWLRGEMNGDEEKDVTWLNRHGTEKTVEQWEDRNNQCLGFLLGPMGNESSLLVLMNAENNPVDYAMPEGQWALLLDTASDDLPENERRIEGSNYELIGRSLALFRHWDA